jgi:hypothetical protein
MGVMIFSTLLLFENYRIRCIKDGQSDQGKEP